RHDLPKWKTAMAIMLALAVAFPLVGASLVAVWLLDRVLLSRWNRSTESASSSS
ncbi:MAG: PepSY domain-containing protein, partial [Pseudomonas chlororaphis]